MRRNRTWGAAAVAAAAVIGSGVAAAAPAGAQPTGPAVVRLVCDDANAGSWADACLASRAVRVEDGPPSGVADADAAYEQVGRVVDFYRSLVPGADVGALIGSTDRDGVRNAIRISVRACSDWRTCPMRNAFWSQGQRAIFLGDGFASAFDVIAHELTHAVTAATSRLRYSGESGAINESMSDVIAELAEQVEYGPHSAWVMGEDLHIPGLPTPIRDLADPTRALTGPGSGQPDRMGSPLFRRAASCDWSDDFCYVHHNSGVGNKTAYLITVGAAFNGHSVRGIGVAKAARLYWEVETRLGPRATYYSLGRTLTTACNVLRRRHVAGFTAADCGSVREAVAATELLIVRGGRK